MSIKVMVINGSMNEYVEGECDALGYEFDEYEEAFKFIKFNTECGYACFIEGSE